MFDFLSKINKDIQARQNIELYLTIFIILVVLILDIFNLADLNWLIDVILATLGLLAFGLLNTRDQMDKITHLSESTKQLVVETIQLSQSADEFFWSENYALSKQLANAKSIVILGTTLKSTTDKYLNFLEEKLKTGANIRIMLMDPDSGAPEDTSQRSTSGYKAQHFVKELEVSIERILKLAQSAGYPKSLALGLLPYKPAFGLVMSDPDERYGSIIVEIYPLGGGELFPTFEVTQQKDSRWYPFFHAQHEKAWLTCRDRTWSGQDLKQLRESIES